MGAMVTKDIQTPRGRASGRAWRYAPWVAGLVLAAGIVMLIVNLTGSSTSSKSVTPPAATQSATPAPPPPPHSVPLSAAARRVAAEFVTTAVARKDLAAAWKIAGPNIRAGLTYAQWKTGNIPVVPYPVGSTMYGAPFKIDYSLPNQALIEIALLPKPSVKIKPQVFSLLLRRIQGAGGKSRWVVDSWVPRGSVPVPIPGT